MSDSFKVTVIAEKINIITYIDSVLLLWPEPH